MRAASSPRKTPRGFTLVELLVALTGGLFVSIAVFAMARDASRFYQREGRLANATLASVVGFERLRTDIARAGFLSSPNIQSDPRVCERPLTPAPLAEMASVLVTNAGSVTDPANPTLTLNELEPDSVRLVGSYSSPDEFPVRAIVADANGSVTVTLQDRSGPMARLGFVTAPAERREELMLDLFKPTRVLRIVDNEGREHYGIIGNATAGVTGDTPTVTLTAAAPLPFRGVGSQLCGLKGLEKGATVNVVNFIRYEVKSLKGEGGYAALYADTAYPYDADRTELVRTELGVEDNVLSEELAAEYAVDFQLDLVAVTNGPAANPTANTIQFVSSESAGFAALTTPPTSAGARPQDVRAVRARLSVRSREGDRETNVTQGTPGNLYRVALASGGPFARVRTLQADIVLNNHTSIQW